MAMYSKCSSRTYPTFQKLQHTGLMPESGSLQCPRDTRFLDSHLSSRPFVGRLEHVALSIAGNERSAMGTDLRAHIGTTSEHCFTIRREVVVTCVSVQSLADIDPTATDPLSPSKEPRLHAFLEATEANAHALRCRFSQPQSLPG